MIRPAWLLWTFAAGVAVGAFAMRALYGTSSAAAPTASIESSATPAAVRVEVEKSAPREAATPLSAASLPVAPRKVENASPVAPVGAPGVAQPVDLGPAFKKALADDAQPGHHDQVREAHRELERETRDEGWAFTMESELQGAMINEIATSAFNAEHIECRATLCEVRLSGTTPQQTEAIKRWHESFIGRADPALGQRLFLNYSSSISENDRTDLLMIFRKPPPPGSTPESPPPRQSQPSEKEIRKVARREGAV